MAFAKLGDVERAWELMRMINPVQHGSTAESCAVYKVEPYVVTADVYAVSPHVGRGGWSWYTGSSGWMYRLILESLLGLTRHADTLTLAPRIPAEWPGYTLNYRFGGSMYTIAIERGGVAGLTVDGAMQQGGEIKLIDDGQPHNVELRLPTV
jgi:cellobiose phosphorylase